MKKVLVVASDHVGSSMAGPGIRSLWFARELARRGHAVTLVVPFATDLAEPGVELVVDNPWHAGRMTALARAHDAVVAQRLPVPTMLALAGSPTRAVYDLYAPLTIEHAALVHRDGGRSDAESRLNELTLRVALENGDAFLCASERQRDLWLGALAALGRVDPDSYRRDPSFRRLVEVVPFGIDPSPPRPAATPALKGVLPGVGAGDKVALWPGGVWNWFDPLTVIRAVARLDRPDVRLVFLGTRHPNPAVPEMAMLAKAVALAGELGLLGRSVFFRDGWVPYAERGAFLLEADVAVSAHFDELESRFSFRTRLLDCIWASLPVVTTGGDALGDLVRDGGLGQIVGHEDVGAFATALAEVLDADRASFAAGFAGARQALEWPRAVEPLAALLDAPPDAPRGARARPARTASYVSLRTRHALDERGVGGIARRALAGVRERGGDRAAYRHPA